MKKRLLSLALALIMVLALAACGSKDEPAPAQSEGTPETNEPHSDTPAEEPENMEEQYGTKTLGCFSEFVDGGSYTMKTKTEYDGMTVVGLGVYDGDNIYSETETDGVKSIVIIKDGFQYILDPATKTCIKMSAEMMQDVHNMFSDEAAVYELAMSSGEIEVNGVSCFYEEFAVGDAVEKYCFDGDELKFIVTELDGYNFTMEILSMEKGADKALFEVPTDYTVTEY